MKKVITICLLVVTLLVGGMTMDAKTTKKKATKAKTTQTPSAQWNGDIPSAAILYSMFSNDSKYDNQFKSYGYKITYQTFKQWKKAGVCEIEISGGSGGSSISIIINDSQKRNWLYDNIKKFISNLKVKHYERVTMSGNEISFFSYQ